MPKMSAKRSREQEQSDLPFAIYARLSRAVSGDLEKVEYQVELCTQHAASRRLPISDDHVYFDNNLSAWKRGVVRPGWDAMMEAIEAGTVRGVIVWALDRFTRRPKDLERLIDFSEERGLFIESVNGDATIDLSTANGKFGARSMANQAARESDNTSARVKAAFDRLTRAGQPIGGKMFGFHSNGRDQVPEEVEALRYVAKRLLVGDTLAELAQWLNDQGFTTARGGPWAGPGLGRTLSRHRYGGMIEFHGETVGKITNSDGSEQDPVFDHETFEMVNALLASRRRGRRPTDNWWLTGVVECLGCNKGIKLSGAHQHRPDRKVRIYVCHRRSHGCGRSIRADLLESVVDKYMTEALTDEENIRAVTAEKERQADVRAEVTAEIDSIEKSMIDLTKNLGDGLIERPHFEAGAAAFMKRKHALQAQLADLRPEAAKEADIVQWEEAQPRERRTMIRIRAKIGVLPYRNVDPVTGTRVRFQTVGG